MRTTFTTSLDADLVTRARSVAHRGGYNLSALIETALAPLVAIEEARLGPECAEVAVRLRTGKRCKAFKP